MDNGKREEQSLEETESKTEEKRSGDGWRLVGLFVVDKRAGWQVAEEKGHNHLPFGVEVVAGRNVLI